MVCHSLSLFQEEVKVDVHGKQSFPNAVTADTQLLENYFWVGKIYLGTAHSHPAHQQVHPECGMLVTCRAQPPGQGPGLKSAEQRRILVSLKSRRGLCLNSVWLGLCCRLSPVRGVCVAGDTSNYWHISEFTGK